MLSDVDIQKYVKSKDIFIENFSKKNLLPASYVLHLDNVFYFAKHVKVNASALKDIDRMYAKQTADKIVLNHGQFVLGRTKEKLSLSTKIGMMIDGKSTLARLGLAVTETAMLVHPGHGIPVPRKVILEIKNDGPFEIELKAGMPAANAIFFKMDTPTQFPYDTIGPYGKKQDLDDVLPKW